MSPRIRFGTENKNQYKTDPKIICSSLYLHVPDSNPVGDQIVAGDDEADHIEEHDVNDDGVIVYEGWFVPKPGIWFEFRAKEAVKSSHIWEDTVAVPI